MIANFPLSIKAQIKRQLQAMIVDGRMTPGDPLLSAKEMGLFLNINRNTVATAYKELERKGYLNIIKGSGTYVRKNPENENSKPLKDIFDQAFSNARNAGFSTDHIIDVFTTGLLENALRSKKAKKVILIDCNYEILNSIDAKIKTKYPIESHLMLIQDIQTLPGKFSNRIKEYDLILCGMNHLQDLNSAVPELSIQTIGFLIRTNFYIMDQILQLPAGTTVGYCCISQKSSKAFFKSTMFSSKTTLNRIHAGIDDIDIIQTMLDSCQIIFATHYVYDILIERISNTRKIQRQKIQRQKIQRVNLDIDPQNFEYILSILEKGDPH
ncbi:MAG: GntR family transcriptional regulator [Desulfobacula sp.]|nr:GntR family transcriptional regulator [Desulfobacula sp.]